MFPDMVVGRAIISNVLFMRFLKDKEIAYKRHKETLISNASYLKDNTISNGVTEFLWENSTVYLVTLNSSNEGFSDFNRTEFVIAPNLQILENLMDAYDY
jgi:hypothetical protein